jgi:hypothetical protein
MKAGLMEPSWVVEKVDKRVALLAVKMDAQWAMKLVVLMVALRVAMMDNEKAALMDAGMVD